MFSKKRLLSDIAEGKQVRIRFYQLPGKGGYARCYNVDTKETVRWDVYKSTEKLAKQHINEINGCLSIY